jgi:hypothetical protein
MGSGIMPHRVRKFALTVHIAFSVGWFGAVGGFLVLAVAGLNGEDHLIVRSCYIGMDLIARIMILPFCLVSLLTGLVQSLGTNWGLFRHYWVLAKFVLTVLSSVILLLHMKPISVLARAAAEGKVPGAGFRGLQIQMVADAAAALVVLSVAMALSVYKPRGLTPYGWRKQQIKR